MNRKRKTIVTRTISCFLILLALFSLSACGGGTSGEGATENNIPADTNNSGNTGSSGSVPAAPAGVTVASGDGQVTVNWDSVPGATSYNLYMATQSGLTKNNYSSLPGQMKHASVTAPYTHTGITNGTTYYFVVTSVNDNGESAESSEVAAIPVAGTTSNTITLPKTGPGDYGIGAKWPEPRFTDNYDGTVADNLTGLVWLRDANCMRTNYPTVDIDTGNEPLLDTAGDGAVTWQHALDFVAGINTGGYSKCGAGHTDWRLPNVKELRSLIDYSKTGKSTPPLPSEHPFEYVESAPYWSSTTDATASIGAWSIDMTYGEMLGSSRWGFPYYNRKDYALYVWPVRSGQPSSVTSQLSKTGQSICYNSAGSKLICEGTGQDGETLEGVSWPTPRFTDNSNETLTDRLTGLIWLKDANCMEMNYSSFDADDDTVATYDDEDGNVTWQHALDFIAGINAGSYAKCGAGYLDWRLPNVNELDSLMNFAESDQVEWLKGQGFSNVPRNFYWSSTSYSSTFYSNVSAWRIYMSRPNLTVGSEYTPFGSVWPVRSGMIFLSISPESVSVVSGGSKTFAANTNTAITWSVIEGASSGGTITSTGVYTAPATSGTYHVVATSQVDPNVSATATINVESPNYNQIATETFTFTGSMSTPRYGHTATQLSDGKIMIAGGHNLLNSSPLSNAELYDPATGIFTATGSMATARSGYTATLLPNGKVLITGGRGYTNSMVFSNAEIYDPATNTFTATGNMTTGRYNHTATLLPNGKVLITGGYSNSYLSSAELYDPATETFTVTGSMIKERARHAAIMLLNGKVLIAGGYSSVGELSAAELYDPASGTFSATGSLLGTRRFGTNTGYSNTITLLSNGKVLITGIGGLSSGFDRNFSELYDPATGTSSATGKMNTDRFEHTATLLPDGKVLIAGGGISDEGCNCNLTLSSAELYDPITGTFTVSGNMTTARDGHTATLLNNGKVLIAGGGNGSGGYSNVLSSAELYETQ